MKIREIMTTDIEVAEPDDTLDDIAMMMRNLDVGAIPIVEEGELIGLVTDRDIVVRCIADGKDPSDTAVDEIITGDLQTIEPDQDVEQARRMMAAKQIRRLPVVEDGKLVGMISIGDLAVKTDEEEEIGGTLEDISSGVKATDQSAAEEFSSEDFESESGNALKKAPKSAGRAKRSNVQDQSERKQQASSQKQGISSHRADEEVSRQNRVVPIRGEHKTTGRAQKSKGSKRKAG